MKNSPSPLTNSASKTVKKYLSRRYLVAIYFLVFSNIFTITTLYRKLSGFDASKLTVKKLVTFGSKTDSATSIKSGETLNGFVYYTAYRTLSFKFVVIGLSELELQSIMIADDCRWRGHDGHEIRGRVQITHPGDAHHKEYETALLLCSLRDHTNEKYGGDLYISIGNKSTIVYQESYGKKHRPQTSFKHKITFCSSPIYGEVKAERFVEWIEYHSMIHKVDYFQLYDAGGLSPDLKRQLKPYISKRKLSVDDISRFNQYETWLYAQLLVINDCAYRTRSTSEWSLFMDFDEYLHVKAPPHSILPLLAKLQGHMWVSFGSMFFYTEQCSQMPVLTNHTTPAALDALWAVERMVFRQSEFHCKNVPKYGNRTHCLGQDGHRKYIINPRQIDVCGIHKVVYPGGGGFHLSAEEVYLSHYRGLNTVHLDICKESFGVNETISGNFVKDWTIADAAKHAKAERRQRKNRFRRNFPTRKKRA